MLGGAAGQDQRLACSNGLVHKERGVDLLFGAGKGEDDFRALVLVECEQVAADGLGALGLVDGVERALFLADKGSQCFFSSITDMGMPLLMLSKFVVPIVAKSEGKGKLPKKVK